MVWMGRMGLGPNEVRTVTIFVNNLDDNSYSKYSFNVIEMFAIILMLCISNLFKMSYINP